MRDPEHDDFDDGYDFDVDVLDEYEIHPDHGHLIDDHGVTAEGYDLLGDMWENGEFV
tara:strand:- start:165 stop:335 length:171 start_codon:yes stop_codon:yes gene_type:complete